jgi:DNA-binding MarR family transcriptional regulator
MHLDDAAVKPDAHLDAVERAMLAVRRRQTRRSLAQRAGQTGAPAVDGSAFDVLDAVEAAEQSGELASVSSVASALHIDQPRASKLVAAAVSAGLVRRKADQTDGRRALLVRTRAGRAVTDEIHRFRRAAFAAAMSDWSDADRAAFARLLTAFVGALGRQS